VTIRPSDEHKRAQRQKNENSSALLLTSHAHVRSLDRYRLPRTLALLRRR
jgi:hypothetical protein